MLNHLSPSSIKMHQRCPRQWEFRYVKGLKIPPAGAMILGSAYHKALAKGYEEKKVLQDEPILGDMLDAFDTSWTEQTTQRKTSEDGEPEEFDTIDWKDDPGRLKDAGIVLTRKYAESVIPFCTPDNIVSVEEREEIDMDGINFVMIRDLVTTDSVVDHKVKKRRFSQVDLDNDIQPTAYLMGTDKTFQYHVALDQKVPAIESVSIDRTERDMDLFKEIVLLTWRSIQTGIFVPRVSDWSCSPDWCGYWNLCRGRK